MYMYLCALWEVKNLKLIDNRRAVAGAKEQQACG